MKGQQEATSISFTTSLGEWREIRTHGRPPGSCVRVAARGLRHPQASAHGLLLAGSSDPAGCCCYSHVELDAHGIFRTSVTHDRGTTEPAPDSGCNLPGPLRAACIVPELPWGMPAEARRVLPGRWFSRVWEVIVALSSLYVGFAVPIVVGMSKVYFPDGTCAVNVGHTLLPWEVVFVVAEAGNDLIFVADIVITFYTAIWEISTFGVPHWVLIDDLPTIRTIYLRGTFCWDVIASIPYQVSHSAYNSRFLFRV